MGVTYWGRLLFKFSHILAFRIRLISSCSNSELHNSGGVTFIVMHRRPFVVIKAFRGIYKANERNFNVKTKAKAGIFSEDKNFNNICP